MKRSHQVLWNGVNVWIIEKKKKDCKNTLEAIYKAVLGGHLVKCLSQPNQV